MPLLPERFANTGETRVRFEYYDPDAVEVFLAGSFNRWHPRSTGMLRGGEGRWVVEVLLGEGRHEYRLVVDGEWRDDPLSPAFVANPFGTLNAVLVVGGGAGGG
jgi:1,4-alpha-glucan branching enzyme